MQKEKIRIKAAKNAPDGIGHGNFYVEKKNGFYVTDDRRFADHIIASGHGTEAKPEPRPAAARPKAKSAKAAEPAASAAETKTEGGTE